PVPEKRPELCGAIRWVERPRTAPGTASCHRIRRPKLPCSRGTAQTTYQNGAVEAACIVAYIPQSLGPAFSTVFPAWQRTAFCHLRLRPLLGAWDSSLRSLSKFQTAKQRLLVPFRRYRDG